MALLEGDVGSQTRRDRARAAIQYKAFDCIITDPPYGRREALSGTVVGQDSNAALNGLIDVIARDHRNGTPLLQPAGGRLVAFLPCPKDGNILDLLPSQQRQMQGEKGTNAE